MNQFNISNSSITNSQIGNVDSNMSIVNSSNVEWEKLEKIWAGALASLDANTKSYELVRSAQELSPKRDKRLSDAKKKDLCVQCSYYERLEEKLVFFQHNNSEKHTTKEYISYLRQIQWLMRKCDYLHE